MTFFLRIDYAALTFNPDWYMSAVFKGIKKTLSHGKALIRTPKIVPCRALWTGLKDCLFLRYHKLLGLSSV